MLIRRRVSFQGTLNVRRRVYDEMATYSAPSSAQSRAQSHRRSDATSLKTPLSRANSLHQPASLPTQTPLPLTNCRWKRGWPMTFSGHAFSTRSAGHTAQTIARAGMPDNSSLAVEPCDQDIEAPPRQRYEELGDTTKADQQRAPADGQSHIVQHNGVHTQIDRVVDGIPSSSEPSAVGATVSPPVDLSSPDLDDQTGASLELAHSTAPSSSGNDEDVSDTDYVPTFSDEGGTESEQDDLEADEADEEPSETHTPLEFQIPEAVLRATMTAPENTKASFWSNNLYRGPEDAQILVHYCKTREVAERVARHFVNEKVVGFDIEWRPFSSPKSVKKNVSLIQLACENRIALFHIALFQEHTAAQLMPPTLKTILESPDIYKVGVAVKGDFSRVVKYLDIEPQGIFELSRLHNLVEHFASDPNKVSNKLVGLAYQVQQHLQLPLYKGGQLIDDPEDLYNVRSSDWSLSLNRQQIHYAAADAYAGFRLFDVLEEKRKQLKPTPPQPLVCDYDAKSKPRSSVSKPRKKRRPAGKDEETAAIVAGESIAAADRTEEPDEEAEEEPQRSQDTEGYATAQESLLDSHQVEGEVQVSSEESSESTDQSDDDVAIDAELSPRSQHSAAATDKSQKRVGRVNLSRLRGPDPGYPALPKLLGGEDIDVLSDEGLAHISNRFDDVKFDRGDEAAGGSKTDEETDEFDDSELEEALQDLDMDGNGNLQEAVPRAADDAAVEREEQSDTGTRDAGTQTPEYALATAWARAYLSSSMPAPGSLRPSHIRATMSQLRAYHMWAQQELGVSEIARQLRDPALAESTAAGYVLAAIRLERMEYDAEAVRGLLMSMPAALRRGRWREFAERVSAEQGMRRG